MKEKINSLFQFLSANRTHPLNGHEGVRRENILIFKTPSEKAFSLLHHIYFTQSQPKLDKAKGFFEDISKKTEALTSFRLFCNFLDCEQSYKGVFEGLKSREQGWGDKTSALFTKTLFQIHRHFPDLIFWKGEDVLNFSNYDKLYLPVDAVIKKIFSRVADIDTFEKINNHLFQLGYQSDKIEVWDDLWFWGFITQFSQKDDKTGKMKRDFIEFNEGKYWSLLHSPKDQKTIEEIKKLCREFIRIIEG